MYEYEGLQDVIFIALDHVTLVPLTMAVLLAMLFSFRNNGQHYN